MTQEEAKELKKACDALDIAIELGYFTGKNNPWSGLRYAREKIRDLLDIGSQEDLNESIKAIARKKLQPDGYPFKKWRQECDLAFIEAAEELASNVSNIAKLIGCHRHSIYYAKRKSKEVL